MKKLIVTALDDNHKLWYDNFIPFILSLRQTDYDGDIGVIDYGLSEWKKRVLLEQNICVYSAARQYDELFIDRHYSIGELALEGKYDYLALYDTDIWFPHSKCTIFEQIQNEDNIHCAYDLWYCTFLGECVRNYGVDRVHKELNSLVTQNGFVWQAGVIVGHKKAWINYQKYMLEMLLKEGDFSICYGVDTTILNLYSVHKNNISSLDKKYNCPPTWGIRQLGDGTFEVDGELVEGIHLTRAYRENPQFNYIKLYPDVYYEHGKVFSEVGEQIYLIHKESLTEPFKDEFDDSSIPLQVVEAYANSKMLIGLDDSKHIFPEKSIHLDVAGYCKIVLRNPSSETITLVYARTAILNMDESDNVSVILDQNIKLSSERNRTFKTELEPNQEITFMVKDLDVKKGIRWTFRNVHLIA